MSRPYEFEAIERKWQKRWLESRAFEVIESDPRPKYYCLEMLPYPRGRSTWDTSATTRSATPSPASSG